MCLWYSKESASSCGKNLDRINDAFWLGSENWNKIFGSFSFSLLMRSSGFRQDLQVFWNQFDFAFLIVFL